MDFPVYRKYKNNKSYFKILSQNEFEEVKMGINGCDVTKYKVSKLPDRNFLNDMLFNYSEYWDVIDDQEYEEVRESCGE